MLPFILSLAALPLAAQAFGPDDNSLVQEGSVLRYPVRTIQANKSIAKRQDESDLTNQLSGSVYTIDITIGTPGQTVTVHLDTGSAELWVNPICANSNVPDFCNSLPQFTDSSTFVSTGEQKDLGYGTGPVSVNYGYDYVTVGSARLSQQTFGVAYASEHHFVGIMGVGPDTETGWDSPYPYVIDSMVQQGLINSRAYGLDIRDLDSDRGSIVFGGIDTKKYSGPLAKLPIVPPESAPEAGVTRFWANLDSISVTQDDGSKTELSSGLTALWDSGTTLSTMPSPVFEAFLANFPSAQAQDGGTYGVDCTLRDTDTTIDFVFGEVTVNVPYADFIQPDSGSGVCQLGIMKADTYPVLGDSFMRAAYIVFDWDNRNIHVANNEDCGTNLVPIGTGPDAVPSIVGECAAPETTTTAAPDSTTSESPSTTTSAPIITTTSESGNFTTSSGTTITSGTTFSEGTTWSEGFTSTEGSSTTSTGFWGNSTTTRGTTISTGTTSTDGTTSSGFSFVHHGSTVTQGPTTTREISTSTYTTSKTYTITSCAPTVTNCPMGHVTTEVITATTLVCPEITATYTIPKTYTCTNGQGGCHPGETVTGSCVVTVHPITTNPVPSKIPGPGCSECVPQPTSPPEITAPPGNIPPPGLTTLTISTTNSGGHGGPGGPGHNGGHGGHGGPGGSGANITITSTSSGPPTSPPIATGGAEMWQVPGTAAIVMGVVAAAVM